MFTPQQDRLPILQTLCAKSLPLGGRRADRLDMVADHARPRAQPMHRGGGKAERQGAVGHDLPIETRAAAENEEAGNVRERRFGPRPQQALGQPE